MLALTDSNGAKELIGEADGASVLTQFCNARPGEIPGEQTEPINFHAPERVTVELDRHGQ